MGVVCRLPELEADEALRLAEGGRAILLPPGKEWRLVDADALLLEVETALEDEMVRLWPFPFPLPLPAPG